MPDKESIYFVLRNTNELQRKIIKGLALGYTNLEIAKEVGRSKTNTEYQIKNIYKMFNVDNKRDLVSLFLDDFIVKILNSPII